MSSNDVAPYVYVELTKINKAVTDSGQGYVFANPKAPLIANLLKQGYLAINSNIPNPQNPAQFATKLSDAGTALLSTTDTATVEQATKTVSRARVTEYEEVEIDLDDLKTVTERQSRYPFEKLVPPAEDGKLKALRFEGTVGNVRQAASQYAKRIKDTTGEEISIIVRDAKEAGYVLIARKA